MKTILRGCAVLALACLLPRVHALTIVQTTTIDRTASGTSSAGVGGNWLFSPFDPALGTLQSVTLNASYSVAVHSSESVFPGMPQIINSFVHSLSTQFLLVGGTTIVGTFSANDSAGSGIIAPDALMQFSNTFTGSGIIAATTNLDGFSQLARVSFNETAASNVFYGSMSATSANTLSLTYEYVAAPVRAPDGGPAIVLLAGVLGALAVGHRRMDRNRPALNVGVLPPPPAKV